MARAEGTVEFKVRLVAGSSPLRGSLRGTEGETRDFWGWLELAELIQQASDVRADGAPANGGAEWGRADESDDGVGSPPDSHGR